MWSRRQERRNEAKGFGGVGEVWGRGGVGGKERGGRVGWSWCGGARGRRLERKTMTSTSLMPNNHYSTMAREL
jgi:hypothetical protein